MSCGNVSKFDSIYRSLLLTKFFTKGWGKPEHLKRIFELRRKLADQKTALQFIKNHLTVVDEELIQDKLIYLPEPWNPEHKKVLIFDMDETLIHCVDDIET